MYNIHFKMVLQIPQIECDPWDVKWHCRKENSTQKHFSIPCITEMQKLNITIHSQTFLQFHMFSQLMAL